MFVLFVLQRTRLFLIYFPGRFVINLSRSLSLSCEEPVDTVGGVVFCTDCRSELPSVLPCVPHPVDRSKWPARVTQPHKLTSHPFEVSALEPCEAPICHWSQPAHCLVKHPCRIS